MEKTFSISKLPIFDIADKHIEYFNLLEKELDKYRIDYVNMTEYEELEKHLCSYREVINDIINPTSRDDDADTSNLQELKDIIDSLIKKTGKKKQQRIKLNLGNRLAELYESKGLESKKDLENYLGVSQQTISSYFNPYNTTIPSIDKLLRLADFFDCSLDYLINEKVEETAIGYDTIAKETGLTSKSFDILQNINVRNNSISKRIIKTVNFLISKLYANDEYETDILSALSEYFNDYLYHGSEFYNISSELIDNFNEKVDGAQSLEEVKDALKSLQTSAEEEERFKKYSYADSDILHILNIQGKLVKLKSQMKQDHEEFHGNLPDIN